MQHERRTKLLDLWVVHDLDQWTSLDAVAVLLCSFAHRR